MPRREQEKPIQSMHSLSNPTKDMIWPLDKIQFDANRVWMRLKLSVANSELGLRKEIRRNAYSLWVCVCVSEIADYIVYVQTWGMSLLSLFSFCHFFKLS